MRHIIILLITIFLISGCVSKLEQAKDSPLADKAKVLATKAKTELEITNDAVSKCQQLCQESKSKLNLSTSPCLSNQIINNWVCDVANQPRIDVDNLPENQCESFRNKTAKHFVELNTNCNLVKLN